MLSLVQIYQTGTLASFRQWVSANASVVSEHQLDERVLEKKMRVLALVGLCASKEDGEVSYQEIADALEVDEKDVEVWVIDGSRPPPCPSFRDTLWSLCEVLTTFPWCSRV